MDSERKLVSIRKIDSIIPHTNADTLEIAVIGGWNIIVQKNTFKVDDFVVYFEIDSLIPVVPEFEFLRKYCYINKSWLVGVMPNNEAFRIKSLKLRGTLSQGLIIPITDTLVNDLSLNVVDWDDDLSEYFGVQKYDPPQVVEGDSNLGRKGNFPDFIIKTKQERVQNISKSVLQEAYESKELFEATRKYHGSSITVYSVKDRKVNLIRKIQNWLKTFSGFDVATKFKVGVCSHNVELDISNSDNVFVKTAYNTQLITAIEKYCAETNTELAVQGELCGPNIQANHHGFSNLTIVVFDIFDIQKQEYIDPVKRKYIVDELIESFGFLGQHAQLEFNYRPLPSSDSQVLLGISEYKLASGKENEGIVWKSLERDFSFKAVSNKFLLEEK